MPAPDNDGNTHCTGNNSHTFQLATFVHSVNANPGNKRFRALCFSRKHLFDNGNHAAKRRVASDIVKLSLSDFGARFLKRKEDKGPWYEMSSEQALLKACQIMRDHKRPDRLAHRELLAASGNGKKRNRATSTPMDDVPQVPAPEELLVENPFGVHDHDVLSGRGAFVNGHVGNERLRVLAQERKTQFDTGNYSEKRSLATEIVTFVRSLDPPGRFMKRVDPTKSKPVDDSEEANLALEAGWEELSDEKAIHKSCQVMRDIDRADRKDREERKKIRILKKEGNLPDTPQGTAKGASHDTPSSVEVLGGITVGTSEVVDEAVAAAEEAMDKALKAAAGGNKDSDAQVAHI
jgi:hypothetical protein